MALLPPERLAPWRWLVATAVLLLTSQACVGRLGAGDRSDDAASEEEPGSSGLAVSSAAIRRLSTHELARTYRDVVGFVPEAIERIPPDSLAHSFDRVVNAQTMSPAHLEAFSAIADEVASRLMAEGGLSERVGGCPATAVPSLITSQIVTVGGNVFSLGPEWAVVDADDPSHGATAYAPDPTAAYSHAFSTAGAYEIAVRIAVDGVVDVAELRLDDALVASATDLAGDQTLTATVSVDSPGSHVIDLSLATEPDDGNLGVVFEALTIEGPLASGPQPEPSAVRDCAVAVVDELAPLAHRRPLEEAAAQRLMALFDDLAVRYRPADALHALIEAIFSSPRALYLVELGEPVADRPGLFRLDDWEIAARLSYALCERPPDATLRQAAAAGKLADPEGLAAEARRLMAEPCARESLERFVEHWLWLQRLPELVKSPEVFPELTPAVRDALIAESERFIAEIVWEQDAPVSALFDADQAWPESATAPLWGLSAADGGEVSLGAERAGLLTSPAVLAVTAPFDGTSPVKRGVYVLEQILCDGTPPPPPDLAVVPPVPDPSLTTRERWAAHSADPACASCHRLIDPIGFAFEDFDGIGRHRTKENGLPVDASGGIPSLGIEDGSLVGGAAAARAIASSDALRACAAKQWLRAALGRLETEADEATLADLAAAFDAETMREAMTALVLSDTFTHRRQQPQATP